MLKIPIKGFFLSVERRPDFVAVETNTCSRYDKILHVMLTYPDDSQALLIVRPCYQCRRLLPLFEFYGGYSPCDTCRKFKAQQRKKHAI